MAIDFPSSPTVGQTAYLAGYAYTWDGSKWSTFTSRGSAIRQSFTAGASQTTFTVTGGYFVGTIDVYLNGVKLAVGDDVTASDGSTVVLASGATAGDVLEVVSFNSFSVANMLPLSGGTLTGGLTGTTGTFSGALSGSTVADGTATLRPLVSGTAQATTSGTNIDFSSPAIPSWVKRVTVAFSGVSLSGTANLLVQIGSGSVTSSGYVSTSAIMSAASTAVASSTAGFVIQVNVASGVFSGTMEIILVGSNAYIASHSGKTLTTVAVVGGGDVTLSGALDRVRITTTNGTDTFDAGSVNILYE